VASKGMTESGGTTATAKFAVLVRGAAAVLDLQLKNQAADRCRRRTGEQTTWAECQPCRQRPTRNSPRERATPPFSWSCCV